MQEREQPPKNHPHIIYQTQTPSHGIIAPKNRYAKNQMKRAAESRKICGIMVVYCSQLAASRKRERKREQTFREA
jgi:hypothetical protein